MKHAKTKILIAVAVIVLAAFIPPLFGSGQKPADTVKAPIDSTLYKIYRYDSLTIEAAKFKWAVDSLQSSLQVLSKDVYANRTQTWQIRYWVGKIMKKSKSNVVVKPVKVIVPVSVKEETETRTITVNTYTAPVYKGTPIRTNPTYFQWRQSRGLAENKSIKKYHEIYK